MASYTRGSALCQELCNLTSNPNFRKIAKVGKKKKSNPVKRVKQSQKGKKITPKKKRQIKRKTIKKKNSKK